MGIFSILLIILVGFYSRFVRQQRIDVLEQRLIENVRFGVDFFSREARTAYGSTYTLSDRDGQGVIFRNQNKACVHYRLRDDNLERAEVATISSQCQSRTFASATYQPLFSSDLRLVDARFDVTTADRAQEDGSQLASQGFITLALSVAPRTQTTIPVSLQTTVASRQVVPYTTSSP